MSAQQPGAGRNDRLFDYSGTGSWPEQWPAVAFHSVKPGLVHFHVQPPAHACNILGGLHGAFLAGLAEHCMGLVLYAEQATHSAVTVSLAFDYPAGGTAAQRIDGEVELMRETGRMQFLRIVLKQGDAILLHGTGVLRKLAMA